jgi:hypothetical protein
MRTPQRPRRPAIRHGFVALRLAGAGLALIPLVLGLGAGVAAGAGGPTQPIENFSHKIHAGTNQIDCLHCHAGTEKSQLAGVPAVSVCVGCHLFIGTVRETPGVKKLFEYWEKKEPIPWVRVYYLPQFAQFKHKPHLRAEVECQTCHGKVEEMDVIGLNQPLTMSWCVGCHNDTKGQAKVESAPTDCTICHY